MRDKGRRLRAAFPHASESVRRHPGGEFAASVWPERGYRLRRTALNFVELILVELSLVELNADQTPGQIRAKLPARAK